MALYMDVHHLDGPVTREAVATAHAADVAHQGKYGVHYLRYWVDEASGRIFCLVDAPDADTAVEVHRKAHGLLADEIFAVVEGD
jgi:hypothetical protein